jgi:SAM-dependent methyltransferase
MTDLFAERATDWDQRPVPQQISEGVFRAIEAHVDLSPDLRVMDFGAGTGLIAGRLAPHVAHILAVDISAAMLAQLASKPELAGKAEIVQRDIISEPLGREVDLIVSAMALTSPCVSAPHGDENAWRPIGSLARLRPAPPRACDRGEQTFAPDADVAMRFPHHMGMETHAT